MSESLDLYKDARADRLQSVADRALRRHHRRVANSRPGDALPNQSFRLWSRLSDLSLSRRMARIDMVDQQRP